MIAALDEEALALNRAGVLAPVQRRELEVLRLATQPNHRLPIFSPSLALIQQLRGSDLDHEAQSAYSSYPRLPGAAAVARDLDQGSVETAVGTCHSPRDCRLHDSNESLYGLSGLALMPGSYRLFIAAESRLLVNAEPLEPTEVYLSRHRAALDASFGTDREDLQANRRGELSERQRALQSSGADMRRFGKRAFWCLAVGIPALVVHFLLVNDTHASSFARYVASWLLLPVYLGGVYVFIVFASALFGGLMRGKRAVAQQFGARKARQEVASLDGILTRYPSEDSGHPFQFLIGGQVLGMRNDPEQIVFGLRYRAYHHDRELIGLEPLEGPCGRSLPAGNADWASQVA
jgi:hypothetical protein